VNAPRVAPGRLVDFHCHLDLYPDYLDAIAECERAGIFTLTVTTTPRAWPHISKLTVDMPHVRVALGLHPQLVGERASELSLWKDLLSKTRYVGEVGLDAGPRYYRSFDLQKVVFGHVLQECAIVGGKILSVHSTRAATPVLDMIEAHLPPGRGQVVLHWFTGTKAEAHRAIDLGCYFSVNSEMLRNERHRATVATMPIERILTETDGPFTELDGRPTHPPDVMMTIESLARIHMSDSTACCLRLDGQHASWCRSHGRPVSAINAYETRCSTFIEAVHGNLRRILSESI
jgi:TatD DNase family protein